MSALGNPILSILAIAASRWAPSVRADGSLKFPLCVVPVVVFAGAGDGVAGAFPDGAFAAEVGPATGADGVCATLGAGVEGVLLLDEALDVAGAALGCVKP